MNETLRFIDTGLAGVVLIEPRVFSDRRGFFLETFHEQRYADNGIVGPFVQDNHSRSVAGTLRGLHLQRQSPQGKLVRVIEGEIWDVAVDLRRGSPTFGRWVGFELSADSFRQLYIPPGMGHGFCVLSASAQIEYKCTRFYDPSDEMAIAWNDPRLAIDWPVDEPLLSARDAAAPTLDEVEELLPRYSG